MWNMRHQDRYTASHSKAAGGVGGGGGSLPILAFSGHQDSNTPTGNHLFSNCTDRCNITPDMQAAQKSGALKGISSQ